MRERKPSLLRDTRGAAMSEALILAFFFTFLLAAVVYTHRSYSSRLTTLADVRGCAWAYANNGCQEMPAECKGAETALGLQPVGLEEWVQSNASGLASTLKEASDFAHQLLDKLGIVGQSVTVALSSPTFGQPTLLGGGEKRTRAHYALLCNEKARTPLDLMKDAFCKVVHTPLLGC